MANLFVEPDLAGLGSYSYVAVDIAGYAAELRVPAVRLALHGFGVAYPWIHGEQGFIVTCQEGIALLELIARSYVINAVYLIRGPFLDHRTSFNVHAKYVKWIVLVEHQQLPVVIVEH